MVWLHPVLWQRCKCDHDYMKNAILYIMFFSIILRTCICAVLIHESRPGAHRELCEDWRVTFLEHHQDAVHGLSGRTAVLPVVVRQLTVVPPHRQDELTQLRQVETAIWAPHSTICTIVRLYQQTCLRVTYSWVESSRVSSCWTFECESSLESRVAGRDVESQVKSIYNEHS